MYAPVFSAQLPARIAFLAAREAGTNTDLSVLRSLGIRSVNHQFSGSECLAFLEKNAAVGPFAGSPVEALLCGEQFEDMPVPAFLQLLAAHPTLHSFPVVVLTGSRELGRAFSAAGIQAVTRPYSSADLSAALRRALSAMRRPLDAGLLAALTTRTLPGQSLKHIGGAGAGGKAGIGKTRKRSEGPRTVGDIFTSGMEAMRRNNMEEAETAFLDVLARQADHVEAALAVARIRRTQGDATAMRRFLLRAAASALRRGDRTRAAAVAALLPEYVRDSLYVHDATAEMEEGNYSAAALGFLDACREQGSPALHTVIARACQLTDAPEASLRKLCEAYTRLGYESVAKKLAARLLAGADAQPGGRSSWLDNFPLLRDAVEVASYTTWAWTHA